MPFKPGMGPFSPPVTNTYVDTSGWPPGLDGVEVAAEALVQRYAGSIHQHVAAARQSASLSGPDSVHRNFTAADGAVAGRYVLNRGEETLTLVVRPTAEAAATPEIAAQPVTPETWLPAKFQPGCYVQQGTLNAGDPQQAVISVWFRVPQATLTAAAAAYNPASTDPLSGVVPLVVFGPAGYEANPMGSTDNVNLGSGGSYNLNPQFTDHTQGGVWTPTGYTTLTNYQTAAWPIMNHVQTWDYTGSVLDQDNGTKPTAPSYLGVYCGTGGPRLVFNLQTGAKANIVNAVVTATSQNQTEIIQYVPGKVVIQSNYEAHFIGYALDYVINETTVVSSPQAPDVDNTTTWTDVSATAYDTTECYRSMLVSGDAVSSESTATAPPNISADTWHHVMFAFDLTTPCETVGAAEPLLDTVFGIPIGLQPAPPINGVKTAPKIWMSFDGRNLTGKDLSEYCPDGGDPNGVLTVNAWRITQMAKDVKQPPVTEQHMDSPLDPTNSYTIHYIYEGAIDPAHFTLNSGVNLASQPLGLPADARYTGDIGLCELGEFQMFIGVPPPDDASLFVKNRKPVNPSVAKKALGNPLVSLTRRSENWLAGHNLGTGGALDHTKGISVYRNNPKLGG